MTRKKKVIVLGGGCSGLSAAWRLARNGADTELFERRERLGGISGGIEINGNLYEHGPHVFHCTDKEVLADILGITGDILIPFTRTIKIKFLGTYFNFPLAMGDVLLKLPPMTVFRAFRSLARDSITGRFSGVPSANAERELVRTYGGVLYDMFFRDYIHRVWGIPAGMLSAKFARERIPRLNLLEVAEKLTAPFRRLVSGKADTGEFSEKVEGRLYTTRSGFYGIIQKMAEHTRIAGGRIHTGAKVIEIGHDNAGVRSVTVSRQGSSEELAADGVISTIPVTDMISMMRPLPDKKVLDAAASLKFRALVCVGILVNRKKVLQASFMYFREISFNRITDLGYFGVNIEPEGATILVAEVSCGTDDIMWHNTEAAKTAVLKDLENEGILRKEDILECHVFKLAHAYPVYTLGFERSMETINSYIRSFGNFASIGRQGAFRYINSHLAMRTAYDTADRIMGKTEI